MTSSSNEPKASGSTITPSLSELVKSLRLAAMAHHDMCKDATGHLLTEAADALSRLSSVGVGEYPLRPLGPEEEAQMRDILLQSLHQGGSKSTDLILSETQAKRAMHAWVLAKAPAAFERPSNPLPPLDDGAVERDRLRSALEGLVAVYDAEAQGVAQQVTKPERVAIARAALQAALEPQT